MDQKDQKDQEAMNECLSVADTHCECIDDLPEPYSKAIARMRQGTPYPLRTCAAIVACLHHLHLKKFWNRCGHEPGMDFMELKGLNSNSLDKSLIYDDKTWTDNEKDRLHCYRIMERTGMKMTPAQTDEFNKLKYQESGNFFRKKLWEYPYLCKKFKDDKKVRLKKRALDVVKYNNEWQKMEKTDNKRQKVRVAFAEPISSTKSIIGN